MVRADKSGTTEIFKKALARFDPLFADQVGTSSKAEWGALAPRRADGNTLVASTVLVTPYAVGYSVLGETIRTGQPTARLRQRSGSVVTASAIAVEYAIMELGLSFGNNDGPPRRLTADIQNAQGGNAWPIAGYGAVAVAVGSGAAAGVVGDLVGFKGGRQVFDCNGGGSGVN